MLFSKTAAIVALVAGVAIAHPPAVEGEHPWGGDHSPDHPWGGDHSPDHPWGGDHPEGHPWGGDHKPEWKPEHGKDWKPEHEDNSYASPKPVYKPKGRTCHKKAHPMAGHAPSAPADYSPAEHSGHGYPIDNSYGSHGDEGNMSDYDNTKGENYKSCALNHHNELRKKYDAEPLEYDDELASYAQEIAQTQCSIDSHSHGKSGENYAWGSSITVGQAIDMWAKEGDDYTGGGFSETCGHFTQMVWKATKQVGCGSYHCPSGSAHSGWFTVCSYYPAGNVLGSFPQNVEYN